MEVLEYANTVQSFEEEVPGAPDWHTINWEAGYIYWLLQCLSCSNVTLERQTVHTGIDPEGIEGPFDILYPPQLEQPSGLPPEIAKAYDAALAVKNRDASFFAILLGQVLELICKDRNAAGRDLFHRIETLAVKDNLPGAVVDLAHRLRDLRNIAAHADSGKLTAEDAPLLESLCRAVLIYVYTAPGLIALAEKRRDELKSKPTNP
jgi:hypothetical protein